MIFFFAFRLGLSFSIDEYAGLLLELAYTEPIYCTAWCISSA
jgi:hypothetical protein